MHDRFEGQVIRYNDNARFARLRQHDLCVQIMPHSRDLGEINSQLRLAHPDPGDVY
jgi:hypothetical protein